MINQLLTIYQGVSITYFTTMLFGILMGRWFSGCFMYCTQQHKIKNIPSSMISFEMKNDLVGFLSDQNKMFFIHFFEKKSSSQFSEYFIW